MIGSAVAGLARLIAGGSVQWAERPTAAPRVYFANHTSHLDFVLLWSYLPPELRARTRPVAARDYWDSSRLRRYFAGEVFRALLIDRGGPDARESVDRMAECLSTGDSLILFPEGTRGTGEEVAPFKTGLFHLCRAAPAAELVPVAIENLNRILPKGEFLPVPMVSRVVFGPTLRLYDGEPKDEFLARARGALETLRETE
ncbi:MAG TPA: lysophospholipid acyltransferase family protein [Gaiellaceae bacterium]|jgi:1-acyl-sn-glycerol-3-phosphate acyltransferase|nr:lysophospholipid acyltransferase family protein [Gaiellaceae bacterium]